jgi:hypothetical protein
MTRMRIVTIQSQGKVFLLESFIKQTKCLNNCVKLSFWIRPALWQAATEPNGVLSSSAFMLLLETPEEEELT